MKLLSKEVTYTTEIVQMFIEYGAEDYEVVLTVGYPTGGGGEIDREFNWVNGAPNNYEELNEILWREYLEEPRRCSECGYKLDDGYSLTETECGACYNEIHGIDQDIVSEDE